MAIVDDIQLYCNSDENGRITEILSGPTVRPTKQFKHFFLIDKKKEVNLDKFYIKDGELEQIEGTTLIEVVPENPTSDQQLEEMKKQLAEMRELLDSLTTQKES